MVATIIQDIAFWRAFLYYFSRHSEVYTFPHEIAYLWKEYIIISGWCFYYLVLLIYFHIHVGVGNSAPFQCFTEQILKIHRSTTNEHHDLKIGHYEPNIKISYSVTYHFLYSFDFYNYDISKLFQYYYNIIIIRMIHIAQGASKTLAALNLKFTQPREW